jgi:NitT/TauT family transport system substrate-binding protein
MTTTRKVEIHMPRRAAIAIVALALAMAACKGPGEPSTCPTTPPTGVGYCGFVPMPLKVGLGYIPSVQFAQFYLAQQAGYYREAGLDVTFENKIDPDLVTLVGQGALDIGVADGTSVVPAVSQGIPIKYVTTIYGTYPSIVFAKASSGITSAADLEGKKIGIPGKYGSSWIMLQALLRSADLTPDDVTIVEYPDFGQGVAVQADVVDAATGFANNEPVQLELTGSEAVVLHVDDIVPLPGPGLIVGTATLDAKRNAIASFQNATLQAMEQIALDPAKGVDAAIMAVPELGSDRATQEAILEATIATWTPPGGDPGDFGSIDQSGWEATVDLLVTLGIVANPVSVDRLVEEIGLPVD